MRSLGDFVNLPPSEVAMCLRAFRDWIERGQSLRAAAQHEGIEPTQLAFSEFCWHTRDEPSAHPPAGHYEPTTDTRHLGLRPSAMYRLRELNLYALEDFTDASEDELLAVPDVGRATVNQIRGHLQAIGLDYRPSKNARTRANVASSAARKLPPAQRTVTDDSPIAHLGLRTATLRRCLDKGLATVGALRSNSLRDLWISFGAKSVLELVETLELVGLDLASKPSQLEKWRYQAVRKETLTYPVDDAPVAELEPWLGSACGLLQKAGVATVGQARTLATAGGLRVRGMGSHTWSRVFDHFGARPGSPQRQMNR